jgi:hypothetical protein
MWAGWMSGLIQVAQAPVAAHPGPSDQSWADAKQPGVLGRTKKGQVGAIFHNRLVASTEYNAESALLYCLSTLQNALLVKNCKSIIAKGTWG